MKFTGTRTAEGRPVLRWGAVVMIALSLMSLNGIIAEELAAASKPSLSEEIVSAARENAPERVMALILKSYDTNARIGTEGAKEMLDGLVRNRELAAFTVLLGQMRRTNLGKDWQPDDALLTELIKDSCTDFLDVLMASRLDLDRLVKAKDKADEKTAEWITRRVAEVRQQQADIDALVAAAGKSELDVMRRFLDAGVDINGVSKDDWTPLTKAASKNQVAAVRLLLERGAAVDKPRHPGWDYTPLCLTRSVEIANLLKEAGANVHAKLFKRNVSILTYVARWGCLS